MKRSLLLFVAVICTVSLAQGSRLKGGGSIKGSNFVALTSGATAAEILASNVVTRTPIAALATSLGNWFDSQTYDPCIIVNPSDSSQLLMFFTGMASPLETGNQQIGRATASVSDPATWTVSNSGNPVLTPSLSWETGGGLRANTVLYNPADSKIYLFYSGFFNSEVNGAIGCATSTDLGLTWLKHGKILDEITGETRVSMLSVLVDGSTLHGFYSYTNGLGVIEPDFRYASAATSDWLTWTRSVGAVYTDPDAPSYHEFHQLVKVGSTYILSYESGYTTPGRLFDIRMASSTSPTSSWASAAKRPFLTANPTAFDKFHVATPAIYIVSGNWYLFYCGALDHYQPFGTNHWQMGVAPLMKNP